MQTAAVGHPPLALTPIGMGGAPLGGLFAAVSDEAASAALEAAWNAGVRYFDTAPLYGFGLSEQRMGAFLRTKPRDAYVISTKVGRVLRPSRGDPDTSGSLAGFVGALPYDAIFDFSAQAVRESLESSLERLGLDRVDIAYIHDPDDFYETALNVTYPVLHALREEGVVRAIGAGMNQWEMLERLVRACDLDAILLAGRYTLLDRSAAASLLPLCRERGVGVVAAGVFNSGILASSELQPNATYNYVPAPPPILDAARALASACARYEVPLPAAAIQFPLRHPAIAGVVLGMRSAREATENAAYARHPIPDALWSELENIEA
jgi:D-threo-aldose 1-dehydrogenase